MHPRLIIDVNCQQKIIKTRQFECKTPTATLVTVAELIQFVYCVQMTLHKSILAASITCLPTNALMKQWMNLKSGLPVKTPHQKEKPGLIPPALVLGSMRKWKS